MQCALGWPCLSREVEPDDPLWFLPTWTILRLCHPFDSIWKSSLSDELHSLDRKTRCNKTLILSFFNNFLPGKVIKNLAGMVDNQHSKHSNTNVSPNREAMLGQNIINSSKPSARWKQLTYQIINTKETIFLHQKWNNEHVHLMQRGLHSSFQQGQWSINTYLDSGELTSTVWLFK